jgi:trigger factor
VPGFAEQLVGMKRNEDKEFKLQFPSDFPNRELARKEPRFKVKVTEIKQERLPELDDEFARGLNPDFTSLDSLREKVSADLKLRAEEKARIDFKEKVIEAVVDIAELEFPPILVERETDRLLNQRLQRLQMGGQRLEEYLGSINQTKEELREELHPLATKGVTRSLVLGKIAEEEKVEVTDSEIEAEIEDITKSAAEKKDELQKFLNRPQSRESIKHLLTTRKTIQQLVDIAKGSNSDVK